MPCSGDEHPFMTKRTAARRHRTSGSARLAFRSTIGFGIIAGMLLIGPASASATPDPEQTSVRLGVQLHSLWSQNTRTDVTRQLDLLTSTGADTARLDVAWSSLQPVGRGSFDAGYTARLDRFVEQAAARDIKVSVVLIETPCWASTAPASLKQGCAGTWWDRGVTHYAPTDPADFAIAAAFVARRYGDRLAALELWNEPNYNDGDYSPFIASDRAAAYARLVKAAYPAIKQVAPGLPVLMGALSFADDDFLAALYNQGIQGSYDAVSVHPYNENRAPGTPWDPQWKRYDYVMGMESVRVTMLKHGDRSPVWITELGWTTCSPGSDRWCVTEAQQGAFLADAARMTQRWPWVRAFLAYNLVDKGTDPTGTEDNFGLVTADYRPKPALAALGGAFRSLRAAPVTVAPVAVAPAPVSPIPGAAAPGGPAAVPSPAPGLSKPVRRAVRRTTQRS